MITQEGKDYVDGLRKAGHGEDAIRSNLLNAGWQAADIDELLAADVPIVSSVPAGMALEQADFPPGWNWGAFLMGWIWALGNRVWLGLLCIIPIVGFVMPFVLGAKGNEWAWKAGQYGSVQDFKRVQYKWAVAGLVLAVLAIILTIFLASRLFTAASS